MSHFNYESRETDHHAPTKIQKRHGNTKPCISMALKKEIMTGIKTGFAKYLKLYNNEML